MSVEALAIAARRARESMLACKRQHLAGAASYEDLCARARTFCDAFYAYQVAKVGKGKARRPDYRAVIR